MGRYCKRLIEVDLPIKRISAHARREKSIRYGHISTLHIWWARRPLAACRAVICASLWLDPADELCPEMFRKVAREQMTKWAKNHLGLLSKDSYSRFVVISKNPRYLDDSAKLRDALLDFIADFANWDSSTVPEYLETSGVLTQAAHEALGGQSGSRPLVVDPFAGGGAIPLEALRVGADAFASDLNPVAVLLSKVVLEYIPKYGQKLADEVRKWGQWVKEQIEKEIGGFYPKDPDGAVPIAYLWARTITCEGPACGAEVPLIRSLWLSKKTTNSFALKLIPNSSNKCVEFRIIQNAKASEVGNGTVAHGSASCPCCGYTIPPASVKHQLAYRRGGANDATLLAVVTLAQNRKGRSYRTASKEDIRTCDEAHKQLRNLGANLAHLIPTETTAHYHSFVNRGPIYGMMRWSDYFTHRQLLALTALVRNVRRVLKFYPDSEYDLAKAVTTCLALAIDRQADYGSSLCRWGSSRESVGNTFARQAIPMVWDFCEAVVTSESTGGFRSACEWITNVIAREARTCKHTGQCQQASAIAHPLPDDLGSAVITDPPYYFSVQYGDLSDFFYVWLKRSIGSEYPELFGSDITEKKDEIIVQSPGHEFASEGKNSSFFESMMAKAMADARRVLCPEGIGVVMFAHTSTKGWEAQLQAMIESGWTITGSWPIDTEMGARVIGQGRSVLASSIHLVCRPRENPDGSLRRDDIGDWRDVLAELPKRIHEWMPRLAKEGVVGADAIFACLGPALEIYSRYSSVEKASGDKVELKEYLEEVWAAVSREALNMIFQGADASGFEEDARLTAMWLWTLRTTGNAGEAGAIDSGTTKSLTGYSLEYDAARKIAQGLGAHLENLSHLVEIKGKAATLLSVASRTSYLFGKDATEVPKGARKRKVRQRTLFDLEDDIRQMEEESGERRGDIRGKAGSTVLDQLHQSMILFATGRSAAMKRFLVDEGVGRSPLFWRLAQALSALYPAGADEKRWVDGVLARKKGLGL